MRRLVLSLVSLPMEGSAWGINFIAFTYALIPATPCLLIPGESLDRRVTARLIIQGLAAEVLMLVMTTINGRSMAALVIAVPIELAFTARSWT